MPTRKRRSPAGARAWCGLFLATVPMAPVRADVPLALQLALVPGDDAEPNGPIHDFRIGVYEVTHQDFVAFLNDAIANLTNERGQYLYFDTDTGDVYIHNTLIGAKGTSGTGTLIFDASVTGVITYNGTTETYDVDAPLSVHPVAGVSWYGAVKFCNWLSLNQGLSVDQRAYAEAASTNLNGWHPMTISDADWATRDLSDDERADWVSQYGGFRLPMDGGSAEASLYNEWYKAAAWINEQGAHSLYGFGRDIITSGDANYFCSGDPYENSEACSDAGSTPVGYYNGSLYDPDGSAFQTFDTYNGYAIYDMSGNLWEWMTDQRTSPSFRSVRGGSWNSSTSSLKTTSFSSSSPGFIQSQGTYGFRVAQSVINTIEIEPKSDVYCAGPFGGLYEPASQDYVITNLTSDDVLVDVTVDVGWVLLNDAVALTDLFVPAYGQISVTAALNSNCAELAPPLGDTTAQILFSIDGSAPWSEIRVLNLTVTEPLTVTPASSTVFQASGYFDGPFVETKDYTLTSDSDSAITWSAESDQNWLWVDGGEAASGEVEASPGSVVTTLSISTAAETLEVGSYFGAVTYVDECTGSTMLRSAVLDILAPMAVDPAEAIAFSGVSGGPFVPTGVAVTLTNTADRDVSWIVDSDAGWLDVNNAASAQGELAPGIEVELSFTINESANTLAVGTYWALISIRDESDPSHVFDLNIDAQLDVTELDVTPLELWSADGPVGGPFEPGQQNYILVNHSLFEFEWLATSNVEWIDLNGSDSAYGIILEPEGQAEIDAEVNESATTLQAGTYFGSITFEDLFTGAQAIRQVTLIVGSTDFGVPMSLVSGETVQTDGPAYDYRIGVHEITNAEFAVFLNNALATPSAATGEYLYHDIDSGDVYIAETQTGVIGTGGFGTMMFSAGAGGAISVMDNQYVVEAGEEELPVVGVTWYGAVKFCNWLTLIQGMPPEQRVYFEGPTGADWYPVTIGSEIDGSQAATWAVRDLSDDERLDLISGYAGYRLPMDSGMVAAASYNEWNKAAQLTINGSVSSIYGFGRDVLTESDANFLDSGDPYEPGPTPVGYFDGTDHDGQFSTVDTANAFGLYDLTGNVREWVQDHGAGPQERGLRGGHFESSSGSVSLRNDSRSSRLADDIQSFTGFRVAQSVVGSPLAVSTPLPLIFSGFAGGPVDPGALNLTVENDSPATRPYTAGSDVDWLLIDGLSQSSGSISPAASDDVTLSLTDAGTWPPPAPAPAVALSRVSALDEEPGGPTYTYWMGTYEVTRAEYAAFLNDAIQNLGNARGAWLFVDSATGDVYLHDDQTGMVGIPDPVKHKTLIFSSTTNVQMSFDGVQYSVEPGYDNYPISGVSWIGALKYCNWLTIDAGYSEAQRAYTEGPYRGDWHPVTLSTLDWWGTDDTAGQDVPLLGARDLNDLEREALVTGFLGFRLPMDQGLGEASPYNEWYKAAAWSAGPLSVPVETNSPKPPLQSRGSGVHHVFAFGRDVIGPGDANYSASQDPFSEGPTPVGLYSGAVYGPDGSLDDDGQIDDGDFATTADANGYGVTDLCGNVAEWVQDRGSDVNNHGLRGGHWGLASDDPELAAANRSEFAGDSNADTIGFRVVQSVRGYEGIVTVSDLMAGVDQSESVLLVIEEPLQITPTYGWTATGSFGQDHTDSELDYQIYNASAELMSWAVESDVEWLTLSSEQGLSGEISTASVVIFNAAVNSEAAVLPPGDHVGQVVIRNDTTGGEEVREFRLTVDPAFELSPIEDASASGVIGGPFTPDSFSYSIISKSGVDLNYEITTNVTWLDINDDDGDAKGTIVAGGVAEVALTLNSDSLALGVGTYTASVTYEESASGQVETHQLVLDVLDSLEVTPLTFEATGNFGGPFTPDSFAVTLSNLGTTVSDWTATLDAGWMTINGGSITQGSLDGGDSEDLILAFSDEADALVEGTHVATLSVLHDQTGHTQSVVVQLTVDEGLSINPTDHVEFYAPVGDMSDPPYAVYRIRNLDNLTIDYHIEADQPWILISGATVQDGALEVGEEVSAVIEIDAAAAAALSVGTHEATLTFTNLTNDFGTTTRMATLHLVLPTVTMDLADVSPTVVQPSGPMHDFFVGRTEVTKEQFVMFLNDAMANLINERGQYLYFDTDSGDVYIHGAQEGATGTAGSGTLIFDLSVDGAITFDGAAYSVDSSLADHPAVGMSWYGAVKFCNWLTLDQGLSPKQRCYLESTSDDLNGWRPATIDSSGWASGDLDDAERAALVAGFGGFRLPMDDGSGNSDPAKDSADLYNEWYKAAAWNAALGKNTLYGFGRDTFSGADANYLTSGDPFETGTTNVKYFDGTDHDGQFSTNDTANTFGLYDLSGNVAEWVQDRYVGTATTSIRGGSFALALKDVSVRAANFAYSPNYTVGMRVMRVPISLVGDVDHDGDLDLADLGSLQNCFTGAGPVSLAPECAAFDADLDSDVDIGDFAAFQSRFSGPS